MSDLRVRHLWEVEETRAAWRPVGRHGSPRPRQGRGRAAQLASGDSRGSWCCRLRRPHRSPRPTGRDRERPQSCMGKAPWVPRVQGQEVTRLVWSRPESAREAVPVPRCLGGGTPVAPEMTAGCPGYPGHRAERDGAASSGTGTDGLCRDSGDGRWHLPASPRVTAASGS